MLTRAPRQHPAPFRTVADAVAVLHLVVTHLGVARNEGRLEDEENVLLADDPRHNVALAGLEAAVRHVLEAEAGAVPRSGLLGVADPQGNVVKAVVNTDGGLGTLVRVRSHAAGGDRPRGVGEEK